MTQEPSLIERIETVFRMYDEAIRPTQFITPDDEDDYEPIQSRIERMQENPSLNLELFRNPYPPELSNEVTELISEWQSQRGKPIPITLWRSGVELHDAFRKKPIATHFLDLDEAKAVLLDELDQAPRTDLRLEFNETGYEITRTDQKPRHPPVQLQQALWNFTRKIYKLHRVGKSTFNIDVGSYKHRANKVLVNIQVEIDLEKGALSIKPTN